jgi:hypothetical protein
MVELHGVIDIDNLSTDWFFYLVNEEMEAMNIHPEEGLRSREAARAFIGERDYTAKHDDLVRNLTQRKTILDLKNRRGNLFAVTESGTMAVTPNGTNIGDIIAFVPGTICPLVLRPTFEEDSRFCLFGEAYVEGYMDGWRTDGERQWFDLQRLSYCNLLEA